MRGDFGQWTTTKEKQTCNVGTTPISNIKESLWFAAKQLSNTHNNKWCSSIIESGNHFWRPKAYLLGDAEWWFLARSQHKQY